MTDAGDNVIHYLVGHAGVGKYTIAKEIAALTGAIVVDNHYINNPIFNLIELYRPEPLPQAVWDQVERIRAAVLETVATLSPPDWSFVFTIADEPGELAFYADIVRVAHRRDSRFVPVHLHCETEELCRRIASPGRRERLKDVSAENARRSNRALASRPPHPNALTLDVTSLAPGAAAAAIAAKARQR